MDWNRLQHTLYAMDPVDPAEERRKLIESAGSSATPDQITDVTDYSVDAGSLPAGTDSVVDFAALAGVQLDESKHKTGKRGQARGSDPKPKKSKPSSSGEQSHPLDGKLVGEGAADAFSAGYKNYNQLDAANRGSDAMQYGGKSSSGHRTHSSIQSSSSTQLPEGLEKYATALNTIMNNPRMKRRFDDFMKRVDPSLNTSSTNESIRDELRRRLNGL